MPTPGSRPVQALGLSAVPAALSRADLLFDLSIEASGLELLALTGGDGVFQSQIKSDGLVGSDR